MGTSDTTFDDPGSDLNRPVGRTLQELRRILGVAHDPGQESTLHYRVRDRGRLGLSLAERARP